MLLVAEYVETTLESLAEVRTAPNADRLCSVLLGVLFSHLPTGFFYYSPL